MRPPTGEIIELVINLESRLNVQSVLNVKPSAYLDILFTIISDSIVISKHGLNLSNEIFLNNLLSLFCLDTAFLKYIIGIKDGIWKISLLRLM
jgi:hypothetical protein